MISHPLCALVNCPNRSIADYTAATKCLCSTRATSTERSRGLFMTFRGSSRGTLPPFIWLYRGRGDRFLKLVESYLQEAVANGMASAAGATVTQSREIQDMPDQGERVVDGAGLHALILPLCDKGPQTPHVHLPERQFADGIG